MAITGIAIIIGTVCVLKGSASQHYIQASGAAMIAGSHLLNHRFCRNCAACRAQSEDARTRA